MKKLSDFLVVASTKGYAVGASAITQEANKSHTSQYEKDEYKMHDNWFGGEPFGGRAVVFVDDQPAWMVVYYGGDSGKAEGLIPVLQKALANPPKELPVRGPKLLEDGDFKYVNKWKGSLENFTGEEIIYFQDKEVYKAGYLGGLVDQRKDQL